MFQYEILMGNSEHIKTNIGEVEYADMYEWFKKILWMFCCHDTESISWAFDTQNCFVLGTC